MAQRLRIQKLVNEVGALQGLATTDSPQFTAINLGHASDTTLARSGAGSVTIEGNVIYRAGGTDVPVTDGGTGASSAADARTNLGTVAKAGDTFTGAFGYGTGAGGTVTQGTSKSTGVEINKVCGQITTHNAALNAGSEVSFTVTNSTVAATDCIIVNIASGASADAYNVQVDAVGSGSFRIALGNMTAGNLSEALVLNFVVIKAVAA
jgi:hypothetical protein